MTVGDHDIGPSVAVKISQRAAPTDPGEAIDRQAENRRDVEENSGSQILEERVVFVLKIGDEQLGLTIAVQVFGVDSHAGRGLTFNVQAGARVDCRVAKRAVAAVEKKKIGVLIVGDVEVNAAVAVQ